MATSGLCFVGVYVGTKWVGTRLPAVETAFLRYVLGLVYLLPVIGILRREGLSRPVLGDGIKRAIVHSCAVTLWFYAMARLPVAEVSAMGYLSPVFVTICAVVMLGERFALRRALAILVAIIGVLVILRPGFREISLGHLAMLGTTLCFGFSYVFAKRLTGMASTDMVVALLSVGVTIGLAPAAIWFWVWPTGGELALLFMIATFATAGHYTMTFAFRAAPLGVIQPVGFLQLVWSVLTGYLLFNEGIDGFVIIGGLVIVAAVGYITWREAQLNKDQST